MQFSVHRIQRKIMQENFIRVISLKRSSVDFINGQIPSVPVQEVLLQHMPFIVSVVCKQSLGLLTQRKTREGSFIIVPGLRVDIQRGANSLCGKIKRMQQLQLLLWGVMQKGLFDVVTARKKATTNVHVKTLDMRVFPQPLYPTLGTERKKLCTLAITLSFLVLSYFVKLR